MSKQPAGVVDDHAKVPISSFPSSTYTPTVEPTGVKLTHNEIIKQNFNAVDVVEHLKQGDVIYVRKSLKSLIPEVTLFICLFLLFSFFAFMNPDTMSGILLGGLVACMVVAMIIFHKLYDKRHEIAWNIVSSTTGRNSNTQKTMTINSAQLRTTEVSQTIFQRIVNVGNVRISDMVPDMNDISFEGISKPDFYAAVMRELYRQRIINPS